jgi:hypothetical protein
LQFAPQRSWESRLIGVAIAVVLLTPCLYLSRDAIANQRKRWVQEEWQPVVARFAAVRPEGQGAGGVLPSGKVLPIRINLNYAPSVKQFEDGPPVLDIDVFEALPPTLRPSAGGGDVAAILLLRYQNEVAGVYVDEDSGEKVAAAWTQLCTATVLDKNGTVLHGEVLTGSPPPEVQRGNAIHKFGAVRPEQVLAMIQNLRGD